MYVLLFHPLAHTISLTFISNEANFYSRVERITALVPLPIKVTVLTEDAFRQSPLRYENAVVLHGVEIYYALKCNPKVTLN